MTTKPIRFPPDYSAAAANNQKAFWHALTAIALGGISGETAAKVINRHWGENDAAHYHIMRAAQVPTSTTSGGGGQLLTNGMATLLNVAPASAAMRLLTDAFALTSRT